MAVFIAVVTKSGELGYSASFPDYPACAVAARTVDEVIAKAKYALIAHIEGLLAANQKIGAPTSADSIERNGALLLAAIEVPDDIRTTRVKLDIPALSLARIDAFAEQRGLTRSALFVEAVDRWAMPVSRPGTGQADNLTLSDFDNPLELKVEAITVAEESQHPPAADQDSVTEDDVAKATDDITAELVRLLEEQAASRLPKDAKDDLDLRQRSIGRRK
jgi:predicted RNase H-like HicB family nuclease